MSFNSPYRTVQILVLENANGCILSTWSWSVICALTLRLCTSVFIDAVSRPRGKYFPGETSTIFECHILALLWIVVQDRLQHSAKPVEVSQTVFDCLTVVVVITEVRYHYYRIFLGMKVFKIVRNEHKFTFISSRCFIYIRYVLYSLQQRNVILRQWIPLSNSLQITPFFRLGHLLRFCC